MEKVSRLLVLMQALRGRQRAVTAQQLADKLSVSVRTVYRDIQSLIALGATIGSSAGVGCLLRSAFFLPPLLFSDEEMEAPVRGSRRVEVQGDIGLALAAESALSKIASVDRIGALHARAQYPERGKRDQVHDRPGSCRPGRGCAR